MKNGLDEQYIDLLEDILENGVEKNTRNGKVLSVFGRSIRYKFKDGKFPLLTTKKMHLKSIVTELLWFLRGDTNIKYLVDNGCHIWDGDVYKRYFDTMNSDEYIENWIEPSMRDDARKNKGKNGYTKEEFINQIKIDVEFAKQWGELGPIYGKQWRSWIGIDEIWNNIDENGDKFVRASIKKIDQIQNLINDLKTNPDSRRLMVNAWNLGELDQMTLPPCHYGFQLYTRELSGEERWNLLEKKVGKEKFDLMVEDIMPFSGGLSEELELYNIPKRAISLMFNMRSNDVPLGLPFNLASYGLLLEIIGRMVNMVPDELIANLGDAHIYLNQIEGVKEQLTRIPYELPMVKILDKQVNDISEYEIGDFILENYQSHPTIKMPLSN
jgi:thymidylate synthase